MNRITGLALFAVIAAAPVAVSAQTPEAGTRQEQALRFRGGPSLTMLLQRQQDIGLTAEQVARLESIEQRLRDRNAPLLLQLRESGAWKHGPGAAREGRGARGEMTPEQRQQMRERFENMTPEEREAMRKQLRERRQGAPSPGAARGQAPRAQREIPAELRPVVQQLQQNTRTALAEAREVLTPEQRTRVRELLQERRIELRERPGAARGARGVR